MKKILVVDDDQAVLNYLNIFLLQTEEFEITTLSESPKAFDELQTETYDVLLLDMDMPQVTGIEILSWINEQKLDVTTIVLTGVEDIELAVSAMKLGAQDYLTKPVDNDHLLDVISHAVEKRTVTTLPSSQERSESLDTLVFRDAFSGIVTQNADMIKLFHVVEKMAQTDNSILIWGESGTGKELIARAIHNISKRNVKNFVAVNAGSFANEFFASEFFGHDKGAFTGATADKKGFLEEADQGTLFLDEIGELALPIQVKLLRVLQEGEFFRLGSTRNLKADVRIIAATNKNLFDETKKGNFRKDLFYRLNMNSVYLPPLKEREGDIPLLAQHFMKKFAANANKEITGISDSVMHLLTQYDYPGNVRELMNIINSAVIIETQSELRKQSLPQYFLDSADTMTGAVRDLPQKSLKEVEKEHILKVLKLCDGNKTKASKVLGISRISLINKVKQYDEER
ncbi:MAG: Fis family transcriptional regulator [Ectothiorhodospiraceae bacterium]|nr:Fis family transcriptional regulator [Ectothiorhodospiraceae bacterium]